MAPRRPKMAPRGPKIAPTWPKTSPRGVQKGSPEGPTSAFQGHSNVEAQKGRAPANLKHGFGLFLGPSWRPCGAYVGSRGLFLDVLSR